MVENKTILTSSYFLFLPYIPDGLIIVLGSTIIGIFSYFSSFWSSISSISKHSGFITIRCECIPMKFVTLAQFQFEFERNSNLTNFNLCFKNIHLLNLMFGHKFTQDSRLSETFYYKMTTIEFFVIFAVGFAIGD